MRIYGPNGTSVAAPARPTRRAPAGGFAVAEEQETPSATATRTLTAVADIDLLVALQGTPEPAERRRRAVKQGRGALDALDALKLGVLSGTLDAAALARLKAAAAGLQMPSGDPGLDDVLAQIELRAAVELAKFSAAERRAGTEK
jgi:hypothetical protein